MSNIIKKYLIVIQGFLIIPFVFLFFYVWPSSDDYAVFYQMVKESKNVWEVAYSLYYSWSGRYSSILLSTITPFAVNNLFAYRLILFVVFALLYLSFFSFWYTILQNKKDIKLIVIISLFFTLMYLQIMPGISESLYWMSGSLVYSIPLALLFFLQGCILKQENKIAFKILSLLLVFFIVGFNKITAIITLIIVIVHFITKIRKRLILFDVLLLFFLGVGFLILIGSPGNYERVVFFPEAFKIKKAVWISFESLAKLNLIHLQNITLWLAAFLIFPVLKNSEFDYKIQKFLNIHPLFVIIFGQLFFLCLFFVPALSMGINLPLRIYNFLSPFWLIWFIWILIAARTHLPKKIIKSFSFLKGVKLKAFLIIIFISLMTFFVKVPGGDIYFGGNLPRSFYDLIFKANHYNTSMYERKEKIEKAKEKGKSIITVDPVHDLPKTIFFIDITENPDNWMNNFYATYHGVDAIKIKKNDDNK